MQELIGKTISSIEKIGDYKIISDESRVSSVTKITCTDGSEIYLMADGGDGDYYGEPYTAQLNPQTNLFEINGRPFGCGWIN